MYVEIFSLRPSGVGIHDAVFFDDVEWNALSVSVTT